MKDDEVNKIMEDITSDESMGIIRDALTNFNTEEPSRIKELEMKAWENITGEEIEGTLRACCSEELADEYSELMGDEDE